MCSLQRVKYNYAVEQPPNMIWVLGQSSRNYIIVSRIYVQRHSEWRQLEAKAFERLIDRFLRTESNVYDKKKKEQKLL